MVFFVNLSNSWFMILINMINNYINVQVGIFGCFGFCGLFIVLLVVEIGILVEEVCLGSYIQFMDELQNSLIFWLWFFMGGVFNFLNQQYFVVFYFNFGIYIVMFIVINSVGFFFVVFNIIIVQEGNIKYLFYDVMEGNLNNWIIENLDNSMIWVIINVGGIVFGQQVVYMNNYNYDVDGQRDVLIILIFNFFQEVGMCLKIDYVYQWYSFVLRDELCILVFINGGNIYFDEIFFGEEDGSGNFVIILDGIDLFNFSILVDWCYVGNFGVDCFDIDLFVYVGEL